MRVPAKCSFLQSVRRHVPAKYSFFPNEFGKKLYFAKCAQARSGKNCILQSVRRQHIQEIPEIPRKFQEYKE